MKCFCFSLLAVIATNLTVMDTGQGSNRSAKYESTVSIITDVSDPWSLGSSKGAQSDIIITNAPNNAHQYVTSSASSDRCI